MKEDSNNILGKKFTLWTTLSAYDRIEIPIIQRDYAQGRASAKKIRDSILKHVLKAIATNCPVTLDFVYGYEETFLMANDKKTAFIPIDGQQRLTTLWLIHWYLANESGRLNSDLRVKETLKKFLYETRPSSADFMSRLCDKDVPTGIEFRRYFIEDADWFDETWKLDPSVMGFITMLDAIRIHPAIQGENPCELLDRLIAENPEEAPVSFYFLPLKEFGLGEEIYTRMNARGKILNDFEKFKSNFYKIIKDSKYYDEVKYKIEYDWVKNLWDFREKGVFITDTQFLNWLRFITQMIIVSNAKRREVESEEDYLTTEVLESVYSSEQNLRLLMASLDMLTEDWLLSDTISTNLDWEDEKGLKHPIKWILSGGSENNPLYQLGIFAAIRYIDVLKTLDGISDFLRVVRNLIGNTPDRGLREWPAMIESIEKLISTDVYAILRTPKLELQGFRKEQREIEWFKASLTEVQPIFADLVIRMDDDSLLKGRSGNIIIESMEESATSKFSLTINRISLADVDFNKVKTIFAAYESLRKFNDKEKDFNGIWGELLNTEIYQSNSDTCSWYTGKNDYVDYTNHPVICEFAREVAEMGGNVEKWLNKRHKKFVRAMLRSYGDLALVNEPKQQLYLLYIINTSVLNWSWDYFFVESRFNFSWVKREKGYKTPFESVLDKPKQIFQTYPSVFRGDYIVERRTPWVMMKGHVRDAGLSISRLLETLRDHFEE